MGKLNLIIKVRDTTESEVRKALRAAGIEVRSIVAVYKEEDVKPEAKAEGE
jgi:predicted xylose isomerase-like sugar epimerase